MDLSEQGHNATNVEHLIHSCKQIFEAMEVFLTTYTVKVVDAGRTQTFNGVDMTKAVTVPVQPKSANEPLYYTVVIHLDENVYGPGTKYALDLRPGIITNQPTWTNNPRGAGACIDALEPIIRKQQPGGGGGGTVDTIVPGDGIDVDSTDPANPIVSAKVDGVTIGFNGSGELEVNEIPVGNTLFVDIVNGDDSTGEVGNLAKPYLTMAAAKAAATSGDRIIVGPGTYPETSNIWKDGVAWSFSNNTTVSVTINDGGVSGTCSIDGLADFTSSGSQVVDLTGTSTLTIKCKRIGPLGYTELWCAVDGGSSVTIEADHIDGVASVSDGLVNHTSITATGGASVTGGSDGKAYIHVETSITNGYFYTVDPDGDHLIEVDCPNILADEISSSGGTIRFVSSVIVAQYAGFDSGLAEFINCDIVTLNGIQLIDYLSNSRSLRLIRSSVGSISDNGSSPIEVSGSNPALIHLEQSVIVALGSNDSITTVNPTTITAYGSAINNALGSGVTAEGDLFYDQGGPSDGQIATTNADGTWSWDSAPSGGITQLTGDGTAGPGSGSQALTLATVNANVGTFGSATQSLTLTANGKGLITAVSAQTVTPAVGSITGLGTGVSTALSNNADSASGFVTQTGGDSRYLLASNEIISVLGSTQTTTSATLVDCTGLSVAVDANSNYQVEGFILFQSASATNGIWMSVNGPTIGSGVVAINFSIPSSATANQGRNIIAYNGGSATTDVPALNTTYFALMNGVFITGATAGSLQFRFASEGAGTQVSIMEGSSIRLRKVA